MRVSMWFWMVWIAVAANGCSDGRNIDGPSAGTSQTHTVNRPVDDNSQTGSGTTARPTGSGAVGSSAPANSGSGGTGTGGTAGTAPSGKYML